MAMTSEVVAPTRRLGWIGPILVAIGVAVAGLGAWYVVHARPEAGAVIDQFGAPELGEGASIVLRSEVGGPHAFVELHGTSPKSGDYVRWQAFIPHYAGAPGRPAIAWGPVAISIRVERSGRAEVFPLSTQTGDKLDGFRLASEHEPIATQPTGPITLTDHVHSFELVGGADWHELIAFDLVSGKGSWRVSLGADAIEDGRIVGDRVLLTQAGKQRRFLVSSGAEVPD